MTSEHTVTQALLEWINSFSLGKTLRATDDLTDGNIIWEVLQDVDPQYFLDELPEPNHTDHWVTKWQNLKHIHKLLVSYIRNQNDDQLPSGLDPSPDLEAVAEKSSVRETNKLLKLLLIAAIRSPNAESYVQTLQTLTTPTQEGLKDIIEEAHNGQHEPMDAGDDPKDSKPVDPGLQFEERVGKVLAENDRLTHEKKELEKALEDLHNRLARLQENNDTLQNRLANTEDRLVTLKSGKGDLGFNAKALESKTRQQEDLIASQEARLSSTQDEIDSLRMSVESLRVKNQRFQKLQDDYDELKTEKDQLARKANAAEKYRQKLQASQDFEKDNQSLKNQIKDLQQQLKDSDSQHRWSSEREVELEEYRRVLPRIEQECNEIQDLKKQLEFNNHALTERLSSADEQHERDDSLISELRERIRELEPVSPSFTPRSETPRSHGNLQKDFDAISSNESQPWDSPAFSLSPELTDPRKPESDDGKKEPESLKASSDSNTNADEPKRVSGLEGYSEAFTQAYQLAQANSIQSEEYWKLVESNSKTLKELAAAQDASETAKRSLGDAMTQLGLANKENIDIANEVKEATAAELSKLREDYDDFMHKNHQLQAEADASQVLVSGVCSERDELRGMLDKKQTEIKAEDQNSMTEIQMLLAEFHKSGVGLDATQKSPQQFVEQFAELTEKTTERLAKRAEIIEQYIEQQNEVIRFLRERIKSFEDNAEDSISRERELELERIIDNQSRELALVSSAWFHLQSRLQNSSVTISRYHRQGANLAEAQKGWLAKQRRMVVGR
ncbi:Microtubule binding protein HOOK3 [Aspergillus sp. HF37]|nr:Microtubule binding protein HOOK3 [Aspergillus sp. HF37]